MDSVGYALFQVEFGLYPVAEDAEGLTLIVFVAMSLLVALGVRFAYYAHRNLARTEIEVQAAIWVLLRYVGVLAALFGVAGIAEIISSVTFDAKNGLLLAMTLVLALSLRQIYHTATGGARLVSRRVERMIGVVFAAVVLAYVTIVAVTGQTETTAALEGASAVAFVLYGGVYFRTQAVDSRLQGTMLDSLLRHLLPVLVFAALVGVVALAVPLGVSRLVVLHVQVVFVIMTATSLMTATIKLRQNLASL
jgi:hypothetical protein